MVSRDDAKPSAPTSIASLASSRILVRSSSVAGSRSAPRWPITYTRSGECGRYAATSMSRLPDSSASMYSGNVSHVHGSPSVMTTPGMSSTPAITSTSTS